MQKKLKIGITYDVKEDYCFECTCWKHTDFSTLAEVSYVKGLFERFGHTVYLIGNYEKLYNDLASGVFPDVDIVFNIAEGLSSRNREGWIPSLLEMNHIPYSGSDAYGLSVTLSKVHTKIIANHLGIPTPQYCTISSLLDIQSAPQKVPGPWVLKPNYEGSSSGIALAHSEKELKRNAQYLLEEYRQTIVCETYIPGKEYNVALLYDGDKTTAIGTVEVVRKDGTEIGIFGAQDKSTSTCTKIPANLPGKTEYLLRDAAIMLHRFIGCLDYNRADFRVRNDGKVFFLELNPLPSIDDESGYAKCCEYNGYDMASVLNIIVHNALNRFQNGFFQI